MSTDNSNDRNKMGLFVPERSEDIDRRIAETRAMLENSRRFLGNLSGSERRTRDYLHELVNSLESQIDRLRREQHQLDQDAPVPISSTDKHR